MVFPRDLEGAVDEAFFSHFSQHSCPHFGFPLIFRELPCRIANDLDISICSLEFEKVNETPVLRASNRFCISIISHNNQSSSVLNRSKRATGRLRSLVMVSSNIAPVCQDNV